MIVPAMNSEELIIEIFKDFETVQRKAMYLTDSLRREAVKSRSKYVQRIFGYKSMRLNQWIIIVDYFVKNPCFTVVVCYNDEFGLNGIRVDPSSLSLTHFTPHFLERYNERFLKQRNLTKLELLKRFIPNNSLEVIKYVLDSKGKQYRVFGRFNEGIGLGYKEVFNIMGKEIIHYKTFISNDMVLESQVDDFNFTGKLFDSYWNEMFKNMRKCA
jgi:hypothetical protein